MKHLKHGLSNVKIWWVGLPQKNRGTGIHRQMKRWIERKSKNE